jgi:hypothetical protein
MSTGKYISLEEVKDDPKKLKRFIKQHPSVGNKKEFDELLGRMAKNQPPKKSSK